MLAASSTVANWRSGASLIKPLLTKVFFSPRCRASTPVS
jgi:hypothetical protein